MLSQVLGTIPKSCVLFEPLHLDNSPESKKAGFSWRTYVDPVMQWPEGEAFLRRIFEGRVINEWTTRETSLRKSYSADRIIVKFVRANRLLPWICKRFDVPSPVLLIRHPCAVVSSQLSYGWNNSMRPDPPTYLEQFPIFRSALSNTKTTEEFLAALWALDHLPCLLHDAPHPWTIITYEEIILNANAAIPRIFDKWDVDVDIQKAISRLKKPSSVVSNLGISGIDGWKSRLSSKQISNILSTVNNFGLSFYTKNIEADYNALYNEQLSTDIKNAGAG